jgi:signal transduction histidine kinase
MTDKALVRRAARSVAMQAAAAVAVVVAVVSVLAFVITDREQAERARGAVRSAATTADDVVDPPAGVILLEYRDGRTLHSAGAPVGIGALRLSTLDSGMRTVRIGQTSYQAYITPLKDGARFAALASTKVRDEDRSRLLDGVLIAGIAGVAGSALVGGLIGWRAARPLGQALALQRRFVADASHELRTPLTVLHTRIQLLRRRAERSDPALAEQAGELVADTQALGEVVEDLLLAAQLEHQPELSEIVELTALTTTVVRSFASYAEGLGVRLELATAEPIRIAGAGTALRRAISALIDNALGHEHPGGVVTVEVSVRDGSARLTVADDGSGLDPATAAELTRRFVHGPGERRFGIGLALVHEVVRAHNGSMTIDGAPGAGARFTLIFPVA